MRPLPLLLTILLLTACSTVPTSFTPNRPLAPTAFSHRTFDEVVRAHVRDGLVDYPGIQTDPRFEQYLELLDRIDPNALSRNDRLALWINAYNASAIKGILDRLSPGTLVGRYRYFIARDYSIGGKTINLYDLERKLLIPDFQEPRIHFAIVCASASCPKLQSWTYEGTRLDQQLDQAARAFINDQTKNRFDRDNKVAYLSKIFEWFTEDFERQAGSLVGYVQQYVNDPALKRDLESTFYKVEFLDYDWSLNGVPPGKDAHAGRS